jgi:hypothetical protein
VIKTFNISVVAHGSFYDKTVGGAADYERAYRSLALSFVPTNPPTLSLFLPLLLVRSPMPVMILGLVWALFFPSLYLYPVQTNLGQSLRRRGRPTRPLCFSMLSGKGLGFRAAGAAASRAAATTGASAFFFLGLGASPLTPFCTLPLSQGA